MLTIEVLFSCTCWDIAALNCKFEKRNQEQALKGRKGVRLRIERGIDNHLKHDAYGSNDYANTKTNGNNSERLIFSLANFIMK